MPVEGPRGVASFEFFAPPLIVFGRGRLGELGRLVAARGRRALLVTGERFLEASGLMAEITGLLAGAGVAATPYRVSGEPDVEAADAGAELARRESCDVIVAVGGGSAIDAGKAIGALATNGGSALDYMEVVGRGLRLERPSLPVVAVPTTAGTGAEATRNAVLGHAASRRKASLRSPHLLPQVALVDPSLTDSLPRAVTAASGLDALTQLIEACLSRRANPMASALALDGIRRAVRALPRAWADGGDRAARDDMALAALESGLALTSAGLGAVHGLSGPLGGAFPVPHGIACAALLPHAFAANARRLLAGSAEDPVVGRLRDVAAAIVAAGGPDEAAAAPADVAGRQEEDLASLVAAATRILLDLQRRLGVPSLGAFGVRPEHVAALVRESRASSSMRTNPVDLSDADLAAILEAAL